MKKNSRHLTKSFFSVLLALSLLVSCMTVGYVSTDAAVNDSDPSGTTTFYLLGNFNDWGADLSSTANPAVFDVVLGSGGFEFKIRENDDWFGYNGTINETGTVIFATNEENNCKLTATGGKYRFSYNSSTKALTVTKLYDKVISIIKEENIMVYGGEIWNNTKFNIRTSNKTNSVVGNGSMNISYSGTYSYKFAAIVVPKTTAELYMAHDSWESGLKHTVAAGYAYVLDNGDGPVTDGFTRVTSSGDSIYYKAGVSTAATTVDASVAQGDDISISTTNAATSVLGKTITPKYYITSDNSTFTEITLSSGKYNTSSLSAGTYTLYTLLSDGNILVKADTDTFTVRTLTQLTQPLITIQPNAITTGLSNTATLTVTNFNYYDTDAGFHHFALYRGTDTDPFDTFTTSTRTLTSDAANNATFYVVAVTDDTYNYRDSEKSAGASLSVTKAKLADPANVALSATTVTATPNATVTLSWDSVANAGSYEVYHDSDQTPVGTYTGLSCTIDAKYSKRGEYTVKAVPSTAASVSYVTSDASQSVTLTVNKTQIAKPLVSISPTGITKGSSSSATISNYDTVLKSYVDNDYAQLKRCTRTYKSNSGSGTFSANVTSGTDTLTPSESIQYFYYMQVTEKGSEYYTQSPNSDYCDIAVSKYYLTGDLVTGQGGDAGWPTNRTNNPIGTYQSGDIFWTRVNVTTGANDTKHYFRLTDLTSQYKYSETDEDMSNHYDSDHTLTLGQTGTNGALYVTGKGTFLIYVDQSGANPKVWVVNDKWLLTATACYQTYNLGTDVYNAPELDTNNIGGTVSPAGDNMVTKGSSTTLTATAKQGYTFEGWFAKETNFTPSSDFVVGNRKNTNATWSFTPSKSVDYYALFKQVAPARRTVTVSFTGTDSSTATVVAEYNGNRISTADASPGSLDVPEGATVSYTITPGTGCQITARTPSALITSDSGTFVIASTNVDVHADVDWVYYYLAGVAQPAHGTVTFYSSSDYAAANLITTAHYGQPIYVMYTHPVGESYEVKEFTGGNLTGSITQNPSDPNKASFIMEANDVTITAEVILQHSVKYYVDMHDNPVSATPGAQTSVRIDIVDSNNLKTAQIVKDARGADCSATLTKEGLASSTIYSALIHTKLTYTDEDEEVYSNLFVKITYNGNSYIKTLSGIDKVAALANSNEMWLEAVNESYLEKKVTKSAANSSALITTNSIPALDSNKRRIYLTKPASITPASNDKWQYIGIYYWGKTIDNSSTTWINSNNRMTYLGYGETDGKGYYYYYVDIPKPASGKKSSIIFQGWGQDSTGSTISAQTANIENIDNSSNFYKLIKTDDGYDAELMANAVTPSLDYYYRSVRMNVYEDVVPGETPVNQTANIKPDFTGGGVRYTVDDTEEDTLVSTLDNVLSINSEGVITTIGSTSSLSGDQAVITVYVLGTIGSLITNRSQADSSELAPLDGFKYTVTVKIHDPSEFLGFNVMAVDTQEYTIAIPKTAANAPQPGYFDMTNCVITVSGIGGAVSSNTSAIVTGDSATAITVNGHQVFTKFTVKYAKTDPTLRFVMDSANDLYYTNIVLTGHIVTKSCHTENGARYGFDHWSAVNASTGTASNLTGIRVDQVIALENGHSIETATTNDLQLNTANSTYNAIFSQYPYVDVTFIFNYETYLPRLDKESGLYEYPYDATWAAAQNVKNKETIQYTVNDFEVRNKTADGRKINDAATTQITKANLVAEAVKAIVNMPENNYYNYSILERDITITSTDGDRFKAVVTVNMEKALKNYSLYVGSDLIGNQYTYQQQVTVTGGTASTGWYAVDERNGTVTDNDALLAIGSSYSLRVKQPATYLQTADTTVSDADFNRSENDFLYYEITHKDLTDDNIANSKEYLMQNFYVVDFFSPDKVINPRNNLPHEDVTFVGGGVVYYSIKNGEPNSNAVDMGYVIGEGEQKGEIVANNVKTLLRNAIEQEYVDHPERIEELGVDDAKKVAYGTEITAKQYIDPANNVKTGIMIRYLPMNSFVRADGDIVREALVDEHGNPVLNNGEQVYGAYTLETLTNNQVFRYSNSLKSYQYVYANGNENKVTNTGRNMKLYSYYVYSYTSYDLETNLPSTEYVFVLSEKHSDARTYWNLSTNTPQE